MEVLFDIAQELTIRLHAGALGSLVGVLTAPKADQDVSVYKRLVCAWIVAVFGTPVAIAVVRSFSVTDAVAEKLSPKDLESAAAFVVGVAGWRIVGWLNRQVKRLSKRELS